MSNTFYPPKQPQGTHQAIPFDPNRRRQDETYLQAEYSQHNGRLGTEGPGSASVYYSIDAPAEADMSEIGTGTDGFGAGETTLSDNHRQETSRYAEIDYRHGYKQNLTSATPYQQGSTPQQSRKEENFQPGYGTPVYEESARSRGSLMPPDFRQHQQQQFQMNQHYPPSRSMSVSPQPLFRGNYDINRPDSPGFYPDRAPKMEKLNTSQRKVVEQFPTDLDEEDGSLYKTTVAMVKDWRSWLKWRYIPYYILVIVIVLLVAFMTIYHRQIIDWLTPVSQKVRSVTWGWIIPVVILFIISFPPLFGHEIIGVLLGVVYGLWIGFGILSLGTLLGEWGNFYAFKYLLKKHAEKYERKSLNYACMAYIVREGGFLVVLLARLSAIPGHFTTAVFATVGMGFFVFTLATLLSMPKQLLVVYLGVVIAQSGSGTEPTSSKIVKYTVVIVSGLVTVFVAIYLYGRMQKARVIVQGQLREKRYRMLSDAAGGDGSIIPTYISDESVVDLDDSSAKLYGQSRSDVYSNEDVEISSLEKEKRGSRWKLWGKKNKSNMNPSMETLQRMPEHYVTTRQRINLNDPNQDYGQDSWNLAPNPASAMQQGESRLHDRDERHQPYQAQSHHHLSYHQQNPANTDADGYHNSNHFNEQSRDAMMQQQSYSR